MILTGLILSVSEVTVEPDSPAAIRQMLDLVNNGFPLPVLPSRENNCSQFEDSGDWRGERSNNDLKWK